MPAPDRALIGQQAEGATITIDAAKSIAFAKVIGETNPLYLDSEAARAAGYEDVLAPPTYPIAFMSE